MATSSVRSTDLAFYQHNFTELVRASFSSPATIRKDFAKIVHSVQYSVFIEHDCPNPDASLPPKRAV
jgi:hypothetical protein